MTNDRFLLLVLVVMTAACAWLAHLLRRPPRPRSRIALFTIMLASTIALAWARFVEPSWIETTTVRVPWKGPPLRVVLVGDLHAGRTLRSQIAEVVERTNAAHPDVVVLAGDFVTGFDADPAKLALLDELHALAPRLGAFAVLGNHDTEPASSEAPRAAAITRHLEGLGIVVLRNASRALGPGATIVGLGDHNAGDSDGAKAFAGVPDGARLLVAHNPASVKAINDGSFDLALAAHTHGGQVCVPLVHYCPAAHPEAKPYLAGLYTLPGGEPLYVTRGIGESGFKVRFACRPEISVLELTQRHQ